MLSAPIPLRPAAAELELLRQHAHVLFDIDAEDRLVGLNEPGERPPPRLFLARGRLGQRLWLRAGLPPAVVDACHAIAAGLPPWTGEPSDPELFEPLRGVAARRAVGVEVDAGPALQFAERREPTPGAAPVVILDEDTAPLLERWFPYTRIHLAARGPVAGAIVDGRVVSVCFSSRRRPGAAEAGVATVGPHRGRGHAARVVAAWRDAVEQTGRQPLYSTTWDNAASRAVARKLGLVAYAETVTVS